MRKTRVRSLGSEDTLEKEMATHSSILAWKSPWTEEPDRLQSVGSQRVGHDWVTTTFPRSYLQPRSSTKCHQAALFAWPQAQQAQHTLNPTLYLPPNLLLLLGSPSWRMTPPFTLLPKPEAQMLSLPSSCPAHHHTLSISSIASFLLRSHCFCSTSGLHHDLQPRLLHVSQVGSQS